jgi:hypothetical protein
MLEIAIGSGLFWAGILVGAVFGFFVGALYVRSGK